jgi:hypothetical protein
MSLSARPRAPYSVAIAAPESIMRRLRPAALAIAVLAVTVSSAAVAGLAYIECDAPARIYQLDPLIRVATALPHARS